MALISIPENHYMKNIDKYEKYIYGFSFPFNPEQQIYFLKCENFVKIGIAVEPRERVKTFTTGNPHTLDLLCTIKGVHQMQERLLHDRFSDLREKNEWFRLESDLIKFINYVMKKENTKALLMLKPFLEFWIGYEAIVQNYIREEQTTPGF